MPSCAPDLTTVDTPPGRTDDDRDVVFPMVRPLPFDIVERTPDPLSARSCDIEDDFHELGLHVRLADPIHNPGSWGGKYPTQAKGIWSVVLRRGVFRAGLYREDLIPLSRTYNHDRGEHLLHLPFYFDVRGGTWSITVTQPGEDPVGRDPRNDPEVIWYEEDKEGSEGAISDRVLFYRVASILLTFQSMCEGFAPEVTDG